MDASYNSVKHANQAREADELRIEMRKKSLLMLIYQHLMRHGYVNTAVALDQEMNGSVKKFEVCENVDLEMMLMEYESYHYVKYQKYPKLIKKVVEPVLIQGDSRNLKSSGKKRAACSVVKPLPKILPPNLGDVRGNAAAPAHPNGDSLSCPSEFTDFVLSVSPITSVQAGGATMTKKVQTGCKGDGELEDRLLKPLSGFAGLGGEMKEFATVINKDIYLHSPNVKWDDIIGLEDAKRLVKEAIVYPIKYPQLFKGLLAPWKGLLLYGPPGTGKTLLAKAVATECKTTFFNISASSLVSKWRGDSEKLVRVLFEMARYHAPSTIFLDEVESMMGQRGNNILGEHEGSRRLKAELLVQMDGLARSEDLIFVLAASNLPWELDQGMLRRLEKRILVGLPPEEARQAMISHWLPPVSFTGELQLKTELDYQLLAKVSRSTFAVVLSSGLANEMFLGQEMNGYSGSDIRLVCKEAVMRQARKIFEALESGDTRMQAMRLETVTTQDFLEVLTHTKPSASGLMEKHTAWEKDFESV
ncbi:katanin p60 ATPase-containing subunit A-like 2 isoform X1 [Syngnathus scovelli]|uniref:katanin p60 ATPase-containing subunit A-like 2 isoform X1 n=1 Tax=Syngnathus scovelli TaxID=161590 RepID=UPI00210FA521|nr:katanin p60 ATPase-containing subunit A-like 2 isoform X1 [Syngnathus scovelli]